MNIWTKSVTWFNNNLWRLLAISMWSGPLGLKAMFLPRAFHPDITIDPETGVISQAIYPEVPTFISRLVSLWRNIW